MVMKKRKTKLQNTTNRKGGNQALKGGSDQMRALRAVHAFFTCLMRVTADIFRPWDMGNSIYLVSNHLGSSHRMAVTSVI